MFYPTDDVEDVFYKLAEEWRSATMLTSSLTEIVFCILHTNKSLDWAPPPIPLLLRELQRKPEHWFWALNAITRENPIADEDAGRLDKMTGAWLSWGRQHGYL